jgi:hypothetical protein
MMCEKLNFQLSHERLCGLVRNWSGALEVAPSELLEALIIDFLSDAIIWKHAFPEMPLPVPMIQRNAATNELILGPKLFASLLESKIKIMQNAGQERGRLEQRLRDELTVEGFLRDIDEETNDGC